jgi:hypothetical protein
MNPNNSHTVSRLAMQRMDPTTLARFAATSRQSREMSAPGMRGFALIKRLIRRRKAIKKHFEHRRPATATRAGQTGRLRQELFNAKMIAHMAPTARRQAKMRALRLQAGRAHFQYQMTGTNNAWNRFVRIHIKSGGRPNVTRALASRMYN